MAAGQGARLGAPLAGGGNLWEALGFPRSASLLPSRRSPAWWEARTRLTRALAGAGVHGTVRTLGALWGLLNGGAPPVGATWGGLIGQRSFDDLVRALRAGAGCRDRRFVTWNLRWLVSTSTDEGPAKREVVRRWVDVGRIVAVQETHWNPGDEAVWIRHCRFRGVGDRAEANGASYCIHTS